MKPIPILLILNFSWLLLAIIAVSLASYLYYQEGYAAGVSRGKKSTVYDYFDCYNKVGNDANVFAEYLNFTWQSNVNFEEPKIYEMFMAWKREQCMEGVMKSYGN